MTPPLRLAAYLLVPATLLVFPAILPAQTATVDYSYQLSNAGTDGAYPYGGLIQASDGNLYGVTQAGGLGGVSGASAGTIFRITPAGKFSVAYSFTGASSNAANPNAMIELPDGNLYGTTEYGGAHNRGTIFKFDPATNAFTLLYSFTNSDTDGDSPYGNIIFDGTYIYGTTFANDSDAVNFGTLWKYKPDLGHGSAGPTVLLLFDNKNNIEFGKYPWDGVTDVDGVLYGTTFGGSTYFCGAFYSAAINGDNNQVMHIFSNGYDGCGSYGAPRYFSDGNLYGTTNQYGSSNGDYGTVYHTGLEPDELTYNTVFTSAAYPDGPVAFDGSGNLVFTVAEGGGNGYGELAELTPSSDTPNPVTDLYDFPTSGAPGHSPVSLPFLDNQGRLWTDQIFGGYSNGYGAIAAFHLSTVAGPPLTITASPATVGVGVSSKISWSANNAFSTNEQYCFATGNSNADWQGQQTGDYSGGNYSGSSTVSFGAPGTYSFGITCGGTQSAFATLTVSQGTATTLTASPNPVNAGQNVTLTATVKKTSGSGTPTGKVAFKYGSTTLATITLNSSGVATLTAPTTGYPVGSYGITAVYSGDSADAPSTSPVETVIVSKDTTATALTITPSTLKVGASTTLKATVSAQYGGTPTGSVAFKADGTTLVTVNLKGGIASITVSSEGYAAGTYSITAVYSGDATQVTSTSPAVKVTLTN